ncbi:MAG TPA: prolyl oligopeptidase family serine peptidase [Candidatus Acidoferrales bacterium]|nr:prolyl oligopeptidase family serine peptidase [Candidatus Acidoferrales bacterium]
MTISRALRLAGLLSALCCVVSLTLTHVSAQNRSFTIDQVLSAPFPTDLIAAPSHGRIAWVFDARGSRNVWVAEPSSTGSYQSRAITSYSGDDGQSVGELAWSPDGESIAYVRGGDLEEGGPDINVLSLPQGAPPKEIWVVSVNHGTPLKLADGDSPEISPKGDSVAYRSHGQIWLVPLDASAKPAALVSLKGAIESLRWSPDGSRIAFVSGRGTHAIVGVYDFTKKSVVWLGPSVDHDMDPEWSPDGKQIAFVRIPAHAQDVFYWQRTGQPWSIWIADPLTGQGHALWKADEGIGSNFHGVATERQLLWGADDRIVFPWERTGWLHLYSISAKSGAPQLLTPGDFEVFETTISSDRKEVIYSANQDDIDRRHVWKVSVAGGTPLNLTPGEGLDSYPVISSDGGTVVTLRSDAKNPIHPSIATPAGTPKDLAPGTIPSDFPVSQMVVPQQVIFPAADGLMIHGQLFLPPNSSGSVRRPTLVFFHGGPIRQMLLGWHPMDFYSNAYALNQYFASKGYVVLSVNYRGGVGYGLNFRVPPNFGPAGSSEMNDIEGAGLYLRNRADVDSKRIGVWGGSYGGLMTALALARNSDIFAAGVDYAGVHDWSVLLPFIKAPGAPPDLARVAWESSALSSMKTWRSPVLVIQGDDDRNVEFAQTVQLIESLRKQGVEFEQIVIPDEVHDLVLYRNLLTVFEATDDFFNRHLIRSQEQK